MPATRPRRGGRRATAIATIGPAADRFLAERGLAPTTRRAYRSTLQAVVDALGTARPLADVDGDDLAAVIVERWGHTAPASWNRHLATLRSFFAWCARQGWTNANPTDGIDRRRVPTHDSRVIASSDLETLWSRRDVALREKVFWKMLYETAARASEILNLDVDDLELANKQAAIVGKGGARATVHWQSGTARLLPKYLKDRTRGPLFLTAIKPGPAHTPATGDLDPDSGRARLSYARAEAIFKQASGGKTLHQLRHSSLTAWAEHGVDVPMLMARSRHRSYRSLQRYLAPSNARHRPPHRRARPRRPTTHPIGPTARSRSSTDPSCQTPETVVFGSTDAVVGR